MNDKTYDVTETLHDMDGGVFMQRVSRAVADTALAVASQDGANPRKGKVTITLDMEKIADSRQLRIDHDVAYAMPLQRGKRSENNKTSTPMHVGGRGELTLFPGNQTDWIGSSRSEDA